MTTMACDTTATLQLPHFSGVGFFADNPQFCQGQALPMEGITVDMPDYSMQTDDLLVGAMMAGFVLLSLLYRYLRPFLMEQFRAHFFFTPAISSELEKVETGMEMNARLLMTVMLSLLGGMAFYGMVQACGSRFHPMLPFWFPPVVYSGCVLACLVCRILMVRVVNAVFFDKKNRKEMMRENSFYLSMEAIFFFLATALAVYGGLPFAAQVKILIFPLLFVKILLFFSTYRILFGKFCRCLHFFVYFCALELVPITILWMFLNKITSSLTVN